MRPVKRFAFSEGRGQTEHLEDQDIHKQLFVRRGLFAGFFCNKYDLVVIVRPLDKRQGLKAQLGLCSFPWWKVITGICTTKAWL